MKLAEGPGCLPRTLAQSASIHSVFIHITHFSILDDNFGYVNATNSSAIYCKPRNGKSNKQLCLVPEGLVCDGFSHCDGSKITLYTFIYLRSESI